VGGSRKIGDKTVYLVILYLCTQFKTPLVFSTENEVNLGKKAKLDELASQTNKAATIKFLPTRSGNVAQSIEISQ
jgi:hypothetical protein